MQTQILFDNQIEIGCFWRKNRLRRTLVRRKTLKNSRTLPACIKIALYIIPLPARAQFAAPVTRFNSYYGPIKKRRRCIG